MATGARGGHGPSVPQPVGVVHRSDIVSVIVPLHKMEVWTVPAQIKILEYVILTSVQQVSY